MHWTRLAPTLLTLTLLATSARAQEAPPWRERLRTGEGQITWAELQAKVRRARLVFMGEQHGTQEHHELQAALLETLAKEGPTFLGCEYFPRSLQPKLDAFNRGEVSIDDFEKHIDWKKTWGFPWKAYRPLFEVAARYKVPVVALNAERAMARKVRKVGFKGLSWEELLKLPTVDLGRADHRKQNLVALQRVHPLPPAMLERYYEAFTLWDDTMAASVCERFLGDSRPGLRALVVAGRAHIEGRVGIPDRVTRRLPLERLVVVGAETDTSLGDVVLVPPPPPASLDAVELEVRLQPDKRSMEVTARLSVSGLGRLKLDFAPDLSVVGLRDAGGKSVRYVHGSRGPAGHLSFGVSEAKTLELTYRATYKPLAGSRHAMARGLARYVGPEGAYLRGAWYPLQDGEATQTTVTVTGPFEAVTEGKRRSRTKGPAGARTTWHCESPGEPLTLVAGPYVVQERKHGEHSLYAYFYPKDAKLAETYLDAAAGALDRYERELGPYPFHSFAVVEHFLPTGYGFAGFTLLGARVVRLPFIAKTSLIHEVVHCWWGNGVRVDLEEGNWCEALTSYTADHALAADKGEGARYRFEILADYSAYVRGGAKEKALSAFKQPHGRANRAVGYGKGTFVFHMLRREVGPAVFQKGLRRVVEKKIGQEIGWSHFQILYQIYAKKPMTPFFKQWVKRPGAPMIELLGAERNGDQVKLRLVNRGKETWKLKLPVALEERSGQRWERDVEVELSSTPSEVSLPLPPGAEIDSVAVDPNYDVFRRLLPSEFPLAIRRAVGAPGAQIVLPDKSDPLREHYEKVARKLAGRLGAAVVEPSRGLPRAGQIVLGQSRLASALRKRVKGLRVDNAGYAVPEGRVMGPHSLLVAAVEAPGGVALLIEGRSAQAIAAARKIPHYGRYQTLLFSGEQNRLKVRASAPRTPLRRGLR
jgi:uncharacterized iron-regulated protein